PRPATRCGARPRARPRRHDDTAGTRGDFASGTARPALHSAPFPGRTFLPMPRTIRGELAGDGLRVAVLVARWNADVTDRLRDGALAALERMGVADRDVTVVEVPGAFELPLAAAEAARTGRFDAIVALGCVLKGETDHDRHI